jgi:CIC family chloride channel protein
MREENLFLVLAVVIGLFSGLLVVCFRIAIDWTHLWLLGSALFPYGPRVLAAPVLGGVAVAFLVIRLFPGVRGSGVNQTKAAVYIYDGFIPFSTVVGKFIICALAIGSGQSLGPEDPSLQIGAGVASALGRALRLSRQKIRLIAPVGAAAGLAAAFNAPISAVLFVIEEVIGNWSAGVLGAIVLSAISSVVVMRGFLGGEPLFRIPVFRLVHPSELLAYAVLGIVGGLSSVAFAKFAGDLRPRLQALPRWTHYLQPAAAGLVIGVIGLWFPQVMGAGYQAIDQAMHGQYVWQILAVLAALKILATGLSFVSGTPGGMFAPTLFIGAMIGGAVGGVEHHFFPALTGSVGAYALVGMGTLFAAFLRAPMTSVFMVLEVSGNYSIIVPVMVSNTIAYLIAWRYERTAFYDMVSRQDGLDLPSMQEQREQAPLRVEDAMRAPDAEIVCDGEETISSALERVDSSGADSFLVSLGNGEWSAVTKEGLRWQAGEGKGDQPVRSAVAAVRLPCLHPDQPLYIALRQIGDAPFLPVVHRADFRKLQGVISLSDILTTYSNLQDQRPLDASLGSESRQAPPEARTTRGRRA